MAQTFTRLIYHIVFSTKHRAPSIPLNGNSIIGACLSRMNCGACCANMGSRLTNVISGIEICRRYAACLMGGGFRRPRADALGYNCRRRCAACSRLVCRIRNNPKPGNSKPGTRNPELGIRPAVPQAVMLGYERLTAQGYERPGRRV